MFNFFRRINENYHKIVDDEDEEEKTSKSATSHTILDDVKSNLKKAEIKYRKPDKYTGNREIFDSGKAKRDAKIKAFQSGEKVCDEYTQKEILLTKKKAKLEYGEKWPEHLAESDHIVPLEELVNSSMDKMFNTVEDIREVGNSEHNIEIVSRKFNNAKRSRTNEEFVTDEEYLSSKGIEISDENKLKAIEKGELAKKRNNYELKKRAFKNAAKTAHESGISGAKNAGVMTGTMSAITNIVSVINGEKDCEEALEDTIKCGGKAAIAGYCTSGSLTVSTHFLAGSGSQFLKALGENNIPAKVVTTVAMTGDTLKRYANGEITTERCILELGNSGVNFAATGYSMTVGQALIPIPVVGAAVGALVGTALTNTYCNNLMEKLNKREIEHQERLRVIKEYEFAREQEIQYRKELEECLEEYFRDYKECFDTALSAIGTSFMQGDADGVISGANTITKKLGGRVAFENMNEFIDMLNSDETDIL